jgi:hypothetical protein
LARSFEGIFGGIFDQNVHLRDSRHAANAYGFNKADLSNGTPRHKFEFFVKFNFNETDPAVRSFVRAFLNRADQDIITQAVKNVTMPSMQIETEILNQYNKKRISQKRINYTPISMTFHDTVEGRMLRLWEMYYEYYFRDGVATEKLNLGNQTGTSSNFIDAFLDRFLEAFNGVEGAPLDRAQYPNDLLTNTFVDNYGYNIKRVGNSKYLIDNLEIYQVHGGKFSRTTIVHPRVSNFTHDTLDYEDGNGLVEMKFDFEHEGVVYNNINEQLNEDELERYRYGDFYELANLITIRTKVRGRDYNNIGLKGFPNVTTCGPGSQTDAFGAVADRILGSRIGSVVRDVIGDSNIQLVEGTLTDLVGSIPGAIGTVAAASIFGGTVSFQPDPKDVLRTTANTVSRSVVNRSRDRFKSAVSAGVGAVVNGFRTGDDGG